MIYNMVFASHGELLRFLLRSAILSCSPTASHAVISALEDLPSPFQTGTFFFYIFFQIERRWLDIWFREHNKHFNYAIVVIFRTATEKQEITWLLVFQPSYLSKMFSINSLRYVPPIYPRVCVICASRWCQYCERERRNCGRESFHHYKHHRSEDGWRGRRNVRALLRGAQHHVPGDQRPAHCRQ